LLVRQLSLSKIKHKLGHNEQQTNEQQTVVSLVGMLFFLFTVGGGTGGIF